MNLYQWAIKWSISIDALNDLRHEFGIINTDPEKLKSNKSEALMQNRIRLEASRKGCRLWRNNVGATMDHKGNFIRFGLCNDTKKMNSFIKSSDLIGIRPVVITHDHIGKIIGQFIAREVKSSEWHYADSAREKAQLKFLELVASLGGDAAFANRDDTL